MSKDLLIVANAAVADHIQHQIADDGMVTSISHSNERFYVACPGTPLMGMRFANCLISQDLYLLLTAEPKDAQMEANRRWWEEQVLIKFFDELIVL